ncbi:MAG TPA: type I-U CRISPR-associated helicase/endonuclease Cas3 [Bryobacteraceae bacterium]|nr:type I-U CRISPR-associated helicase/endonuclease Cas3 [Bryobacteraceae bacterium]
MGAIRRKYSGSGSGRGRKILRVRFVSAPSLAGSREVTFATFFRAVWGEDKNPFPWQERLAELALAGKWPGSIGLPTAAGKTALIDIAVYALAMGAPGAARRLFFVVDRRVIVDEAARRAADLADKLCQADPESDLGKVAASLRKIGDGDDAKPLETAVLRGGIVRDDSWAKSPRQPVVVCSTVDQLGSSILFRAYGMNCYNWPIRAALAAHDSLIILDEAHLSQPFAETLQRVREYRTWASDPVSTGLTVVEMSATPRDEQVFREELEDCENVVLKRRWTASKQARLVEEGKSSEDETQDGGFDALVKALVVEAKAMREKRGAFVIGVIANRVGTARSVYLSLSKEEQADAILLIGRARPYDRDRRWEEWRELIGLGREDGQPSRPIFVVATQCIEVGANIDFDALVTEVASIDALEQRFGRLNRAGREAVSHAAIVAQKDQVGARAEDPIYGKALAATWRWLKGHVSKEERVVQVPAEGKKKPKTKKEKVEFVEMGVLALRQALNETPDKISLVADRKNAPVLMPAHMDLLSQTSPEPAVSPDPSLFLHGPETAPADVTVVWRADLSEKNRKLWCEIISTCPPSAAEAISLPVWVVRKWLCRQSPADTGDMEGTPAQSPRIKGDSRLAICWMGPDDSKLLEKWEDVRPGMMLVVPADYGGCDEWGWNPESGDAVRDVGDAVKWALGHPILRLDPQLAESWKYAELAEGLRKCELIEVKDLLGSFSKADLAGWITRTIGALLNGKPKLVESPGGVLDQDNDKWAAIRGRSIFEQESSRSAFTGKVLLGDHLGGCARWAAGFAADLPEQLRKTVVRAAMEHDIGKADPRFQAWLRGGNPTKRNELLAKSGMDRAVIERARRLSGYPKGGRHELMSVALLMNDKAEITDIDQDLLLHLVGSHHGRCRPFASVEADSQPVEVKHQERVAGSDHKLEGLASGISERFWNLTRRYGWYGLAYLEMLVRLADHRRSEEEESISNA